MATRRYKDQEQILAGLPEGFWHGLQQRIRQALDGTPDAQVVLVQGDTYPRSFYLHVHAAGVHFAFTIAYTPSTRLGVNASDGLAASVWTRVRAAVIEARAEYDDIRAALEPIA